MQNTDNLSKAAVHPDTAAAHQGPPQATPESQHSPTTAIITSNQLPASLDGAKTSAVQSSPVPRDSIACMDANPALSAVLRALVSTYGWQAVASTVSLMSEATPSRPSFDPDHPAPLSLQQQQQQQRDTGAVMLAQQQRDFRLQRQQRQHEQPRQQPVTAAAAAHQLASEQQRRLALRQQQQHQITAMQLQQQQLTFAAMKEQHSRADALQKHPLGATHASSSPPTPFTLLQVPVEISDLSQSGTVPTILVSSRHLPSPATTTPSLNLASTTIATHAYDTCNLTNHAPTTATASCPVSSSDAATTTATTFESAAAAAVAALQHNRRIRCGALLTKPIAPQFAKNPPSPPSLPSHQPSITPPLRLGPHIPPQDTTLLRASSASAAITHSHAAITPASCTPVPVRTIPVIPIILAPTPISRVAYVPTVSPSTARSAAPVLLLSHATTQPRAAISASALSHANTAAQATLSAALPQLQQLTISQQLQQQQVQLLQLQAALNQQGAATAAARAADQQGQLRQQQRQQQQQQKRHQQQQARQQQQQLQQQQLSMSALLNELQNQTVDDAAPHLTHTQQQQQQQAFGSDTRSSSSHVATSHGSSHRHSQPRPAASASHASHRSLAQAPASPLLHPVLQAWLQDGSSSTIPLPAAHLLIGAPCASTVRQLLNNSSGGEALSHGVSLRQGGRGRASGDLMASGTGSTSAGLFEARSAATATAAAVAAATATAFEGAEALSAPRCYDMGVSAVNAASTSSSLSSLTPQQRQQLHQLLAPQLQLPKQLAPLPPQVAHMLHLQTDEQQHRRHQQLHTDGLQLHRRQQQLQRQEQEVHHLLLSSHQQQQQQATTSGSRHRLHLHQPQSAAVPAASGSQGRFHHLGTHASGNGQEEHADQTVHGGGATGGYFSALGSVTSQGNERRHTSAPSLHDTLPESGMLIGGAGECGSGSAAALLAEFGNMEDFMTLQDLPTGDSGTQGVSATCGNGGSVLGKRIAPDPLEDERTFSAPQWQ